MPSTTVVVGSKVGLHDRPASLLVKASSNSGLSVTVSKPGETGVNAASLLSVLSLGVKMGESIEINVANGDNADELLAELVDIVSRDHDE